MEDSKNSDQVNKKKLNKIQPFVKKQNDNGGPVQLSIPEATK